MVWSQGRPVRVLKCPRAIHLTLKLCLPAVYEWCVIKKSAAYRWWSIRPEKCCMNTVRLPFTHRLPPLLYSVYVQYFHFNLSSCSKTQNQIPFHEDILGNVHDSDSDHCCPIFLFQRNRRRRVEKNPLILKCALAVFFTVKKTVFCFNSKWIWWTSRQLLLHTWTATLSFVRHVHYCSVCKCVCLQSGAGQVVKSGICCFRAFSSCFMR